MEMTRFTGRLGARPSHGTLVMTDYVFLFALFLAIAIAVDPLEAGLDENVYVKHLPLLAILMAGSLALSGARVFQRTRHFPGVSRPFAPLMMLAAFIAAGGIYARLGLGIQNSFLVAGLYAMAAPLTAAMFLRSGEPQRVLGTYLAMLAAWGVLVFAGLAANYGVRQVYHELEYLFPPLAVLFAFSQKGGRIRWGAVGLFLLMGALFKKNTGYLSTVIASAYLLAFYFWPQWRKRGALVRITRAHWTLIGILAFSALAAYLLINRDQYLPSGSPEYRLVTYARAWDRFLESPVWGSGFTAAASEKFTSFDTGVSDNILPTHSDVLDILAQGGVLGILLWIGAVGSVAKLAWRRMPEVAAEWPSLLPYANALACMSIAGIVTYAFNPILLQPAKALLLWSNAGFLVGVMLLPGASSATEKGIRP